MFGIIAAYAVVPYVGATLMLTGGIQPVVGYQEQQEVIVHNGYLLDSVVQDYANYAYNIGGMDFVKLIECENGRRDPQRVSKTHDYGLCQLNYRYNKKFINSSDFSDPYKQLDYCYEKYKTNPKLRYGPDRRIEGQRCSDYVSDRFNVFVSNNRLISANIN